MDEKTIVLIVILIIILIFFNIKNKTFETTKADLGTCQNSLQTTQTDLGTCQTSLNQTDTGICQNNLQTTQADLGICQNSLQTIQETLGTCQNSLKTTQTDLGIQKNNLQTTQTTLETCQNSLKTTQADLGTQKNNLQTTQVTLGTCQNSLKTIETNLKTCQTNYALDYNPLTYIDGYTLRGAGKLGGMHNDDYLKPNYSTFSVKAVRGLENSDIPLIQDIGNYDNIDLNTCATKCNENIDCKGFNYYTPVRFDSTRQNKTCKLLSKTGETRTMIPNIGYYVKN